MTDIVRDLGVLALGTRLRRLSDQLIEQVAEVYRAQSIDLNPRFFPLIAALIRMPVATVVELSKSIGISHSAIVQTLALMKQHGLVTLLNSKSDSRKTEVRLSADAKKIIKSLERTWNTLQELLEGILTKSKGSLMENIESLEAALNKNSLLTRLNKPKDVDLQIFEWDARYAASFYDLNEAWISKYFKMEPGDKEFLMSPQKIIDHGGMIFFAKLDGMIIGTAAMLKRTDGSYELARMAVSSGMQGRGIGKRLLVFALAWVKTKQPRKIYLETSSKLKAALTLYQSTGFKVIENKRLNYARADTYMEYINK